MAVPDPECAVPPLTVPSAQAVVTTLQRARVRLALAESCTAGLVSALLAGADGAGQVLRGGVVAYDDRVKFDLLRVSRGPVIARPTAVEMAAGAARLLGADVGLATTGVVGPAPVEGQRVGTVWVGVHGPGDRADAHELRLDDTDPAAVRRHAADRALEFLLGHLRSVRA